MRREEGIDVVAERCDLLFALRSDVVVGANYFSLERSPLLLRGGDWVRDGLGLMKLKVRSLRMTLDWDWFLGTQEPVRRCEYCRYPILKPRKDQRFCSGNCRHNWNYNYGRGKSSKEQRRRARLESGRGA
jgi:hypothetical protein